MITYLNLVSYLTALLENHVIPHAICLPAIIGEHKVRTLGSEKLTFDCDRKGITVEEKRLRSDFLMGQNGVLYMLDDLLLPDRGNSVKILSNWNRHPSCITHTSNLPSL
jgi:uncharacterized surface protein with fasciclin (FAS1) repeats